MLAAYRVSERRACRVAKVHRSLVRYQAQADDQAVLRQRIRGDRRSPGALRLPAHLCPFAT